MKQLKSMVVGEGVDVDLGLVDEDGVAPPVAVPVDSSNEAIEEQGPPVVEEHLAPLKILA